MSKNDGERGAVLVTVALTLTLLLSFLALAVDIGSGYVERRRVQMVADAASMAGTEMLLDNGTDAQILTAINEYVMVRNLLSPSEQTREYTAQWMRGTDELGEIGNGARPAGVTGVLVTVRGHVPTTFARVFHINELDASAQGGSGGSPLDVVVVLDKSGSMDDDSCFLKATTSGFSLRSHFKTAGKCQEVSTGDGLSSSNCGNCKGTWKTSPTRCTWPGGTTMGSEVNSICGSVQTNQTACIQCKGIWNSAKPEPVADLRTAASGFVDLVQAQLGPTFPHMGLVSYSDTATLNVGLTGTLSTVKSAIAGISPVGYTNCEDGMYKARMELTTSGRQRWTAVKVILFMSDGNANRCRTQGSCTTSQAKQYAINEAQLAASQDIAVYTIGLGAEADQDLLRKMAAAGGGVFLFAPTSADLAAVYTQMFQKIQPMRLIK